MANVKTIYSCAVGENHFNRNYIAYIRFPLHSRIYSHMILDIYMLTLKWRDAFLGKANSSATLRCPAAKKKNTLYSWKNQTRNEKWLGYSDYICIYNCFSLFSCTRVRELYVYKCIWKHRAVQFVFFACLLVRWCNTHRLQRLYIFYFLSLNRVAPPFQKKLIIFFFSF